MAGNKKETTYRSAREKFLGLSLESTRKSYYPQLQQQLEVARESELRLQLLIDNLPARISCVDTQQRYLLVNSEYVRYTGLPRPRIIGATIEQIIGHENYLRKKAYIDKALGGEHVHFDMMFTAKDGSQRWNEVSFVPVLDNSSVVASFYILARDVTEKKEAEQERAMLQASLQDTQKFKAIGTLAGGIAHDFNNILMGIQGHASLMGIKLDASHPLMEHITAIEEFVQNASNLTSQLLGFARGGKYEVRPTDLADLLISSSRMFGRTHKEISIYRKIPSSPVIADVDNSQISQVLLNMYVNAWQAMGDEGSLYLEITTLELDRVHAAAKDIDPGSYAKISITDTGAGMSEETSRRVFDPFFTTKDKQRGTGLGLASAYGIVKNHKGFIAVRSEIGVGTTFDVYLPLSSTAAVIDEIHEQIPASGGGTETILIVDDEAMVLEVGRQMLASLGYEVITASGGREALDIITGEHSPVDLVILDMIMPVMGGGETFSLIRQHRPEMPVLLCSGYSVDSQAEEILKKGCSAFIQKPFDIPELSRIIRTILD
jgi:PAS domain S-box-containing protein